MFLSFFFMTGLLCSFAFGISILGITQTVKLPRLSWKRPSDPNTFTISRMLTGRAEIGSTIKDEPR